MFRLGRTFLLSILAGSICGGVLLAAVLSFHKTTSVSAPDAVAETPSSILNFIPIAPAPVLIPTEQTSTSSPATVASSSLGESVSALLKANSVLAASLGGTQPASSDLPDAGELVGAPVSLVIPKIKLRTAVQAVGFAPSGAVGIPSNYTDVAWFKFGPRPGQVGNATMDGHVVTHSFGPGVFTDIHTLVPGDEVDVDTAAGEHLVFKVTKVIAYDVDQAPVEEIFGPTSKRMLNLITCDGAWVQARKMYDQRLVVYTELVQ